MISSFYVVDSEALLCFRNDGVCKSRSTGRPTRELYNLQLFLPLLIYLVAFIVDSHSGVSIHPSRKACSRLISNP